MESTDRLCLDGLRPRACALVVRVEGDDVLAARLRDLGFWPGTPIEVVRRVPWGGPMQVRFRGYRLALRRSEAARVVVTEAVR